MEISWLQIYFITRLDGIKLFLTIGSAALLSLSLLFSWAYLDGSKFPKWSDLKIFGYGIIASILLVVVNVLTPTTKEAAAILVIPKVMQSSEVKKTCGEIYNLALDWVEYLKPPKENGGNKQ